MRGCANRFQPSWKRPASQSLSAWSTQMAKLALDDGWSVNARGDVLCPDHKDKKTVTRGSSPSRAKFARNCAVMSFALYLLAPAMHLLNIGDPGYMGIIGMAGAAISTLCWYALRQSELRQQGQSNQA